MSGTGTRFDLTFAVESATAKIRTVMIRPATREAQREVMRRAREAGKKAGRLPRPIEISAVAISVMTDLPPEAVKRLSAADARGLADKIYREFEKLENSP